MGYGGVWSGRGGGRGRCFSAVSPAGSYPQQYSVSVVAERGGASINLLEVDYDKM